MKFIIFFISIIIVTTIGTPIQYGAGWSSNDGGWNSGNSIGLYNNGLNNGWNGRYSQWWPSQNVIVRKHIQESPKWNIGYGGTGWNNNNGGGWSTNGGWKNGGWNNGGWNNGGWKNNEGWRDSNGYANGWQYTTGTNGLNSGWKNNYSW